MKSQLTYKGEKVSSYDENAQFEKGNRQMHKDLLEDILSFLNFRPDSFIDLGCGTGFFSSSFYRLYPNIQGCLIDGSEEMLAKAKEKFSSTQHRIKFAHSSFQKLDFEEHVSNADIIFSCLAIHHLDDEEKEVLYQKIYENLSDRGQFILFDLFKLEDTYKQALLEHIACRDIQRKLRNFLEIDEGIEIKALNLENIKNNDRNAKEKEGDQESYLTQILSSLEKVGFENIVIVNQENRFLSLIASKKIL